jgi:hypothetical protein
MAVYSICLDGGRMPFFSAGIDLFRMGKTEARYAMMRHQMETDANCTIVNVTGFGNAVNIDFEDVLVNADVMYHAMQSAWMKLDRSPYTEQLPSKRTTSVYDIGAFKASANSCAFSVTLPLRARMFLKASLTLLLGR